MERAVGYIVSLLPIIVATAILRLTLYKSPPAFRQDDTSGISRHLLQNRRSAFRVAITATVLLLAYVANALVGYRVTEHHTLWLPAVVLGAMLAAQVTAVLALSVRD